MNIHPTAIVHPKAEIDSSVVIGPYSIIGEHVKIGKCTVIANNVVIEGYTSVGENNRIFSYAVLGTGPQDISYKGEKVYLNIGNNNLLREYVTVNAGSPKGESVTIVGNGCMIMAYCHIAHDCLVEDNVIMANAVQIGGHAKIEKDANFGGLAGIHHFATIGEKSFVGGLTRIVHDVPPYMTVEGHPAKVKAVNVIGLRRHGFSSEKIQAIKNAMKLVYRSGIPKSQALKILEEQQPQFEEVLKLVSFLKALDEGNQGRARERLRKVSSAH